MQPQNLRLMDAVQRGVAWTADTDIQTLSLNQYLRLKATNPSGSGKRIYIYCFGGFTPVSGGTVLKAYRNPSTAVSANQITPANQNFASTQQSVLTIAWDTSSTNVAGTPYRSLPIPANIWCEFKSEILLLDPGQSIGLAAQILVAGNAIAHMSWIEESLA